MDGLATCSSAPELRGYHEVWSTSPRPPRNRASGSNRYRGHGHAATRSVRIRGGRRGISKVLLLAYQPRAFKKKIFSFSYPLRCCACVFYYRYIDQILGLMDDDESGSGPGTGDLEVYEKVVSFLSGNVEPTSDLDDVSLAYVQIPHLEMTEGE
jgi:hypothetical protein